MKKRLPLILTLLVLAGGGYWGYTYLNAPAKLEYLKAVVTRGDIQSAISATGTLQPTLTVNVGSQVSGNVLQMLADFNTPVKQGQLIAVIDPSTYQTKVESAEASLRSAQTQILSAQVAERRSDVDISNAKLAIVNQRASIKTAESRLNEAKRQLDQKKTLFQQGVGTKDAADAAQASYDQAVLSLEAANIQLQTAEASLKSTEASREVTLTQKTTAASQITNAEATLQAAKLDLERTKIVAPVDGIVIARNMSPGQTVQASTSAPQLFQIAKDLSDMHLEVSLDESDISRVEAGLQASFTVDAYPGQQFRGEVIQVQHSPTNVQNVITYTVVIAVDNSDMRLFPGMTANTRIVTESVQNVLRVPSAATRFRPPADFPVVGDVGKGKGRGNGGKDGGDFKGGAPTGNVTGDVKGGAKQDATNQNAPKQVARADRKSGIESVTAPQAGAAVTADGAAAPAADATGGGRGRRGQGGNGGGNFDPSQFKGKDGQPIDRSQFQGKNFDRSQFQGKGGGNFDPSQFKGGANGGGRQGGNAGNAGRNGGGNQGGFNRNGGGAQGGFGAAGFAGRGGGGRGGAPGVRPATSQQQTVYRLNAKKELEAVRIRTGISDGAWAALLSTNLDEGAELVTAIEGLPTTTKAKAGNNAPGFPGGQPNFGGGNNKGGGGRGF